LLVARVGLADPFEGLLDLELDDLRGHDAVLGLDETTERLGGRGHDGIVGGGVGADGRAEEVGELEDLLAAVREVIDIDQGVCDDQEEDEEQQEQ